MRMYGACKEMRGTVRSVYGNNSVGIYVHVWVQAGRADAHCQRQLRPTRASPPPQVWKRDALNALAFEWAPSKEDCRWHAALHQLREVRALAAVRARVPVSRARQLSQWLRAQGGLYAGTMSVAGQDTATNKLCPIIDR